jgi:PEP-CTERM motif
MTRNGISRSKVAKAGIPAASLGCLVIATAFLASTSNAAPMFFTNKAAFLAAAAATPLQTETFDTTPGINPMSNTAPFSTSLKNIMLSRTGTSTFGIRAPAFQGGSGNAAAWADSGLGPLTFTFPSPINTVGVDIWDLGDYGATTLTLTTDHGSQILFNNFSGSDNNLKFGGVIDTSAAFVSARFTNTVTTDYIEFDDLRFGVVPEPSIFAIALLGLAVLGFRRAPRIVEPVA